MKKYSPVKHFYSLVELLVVVALAAILLGIGLPAFNVLTKGNAMTSSINDVAGKIKATRAYAVSNNCYTALIFPARTDNGWSLTDWRVKLSNRSCRPCIVQPRDNESQWVFDSWIDGENWMMFNDGIVLSDTAPLIDSNCGAFGFWERVLLQSELTSHSGINPTDPATASSRIQIPNSSIDPSGTNSSIVFTRVMIFRPNGQLLNNVILTLQEGTIVPTSSAPDVVATQNVPVYYALGVNKFNGKITYYEPITP